MTFHTCFRASKSTARHLNMWYYNHRCVRASGMPEYCLVMQLHSIMVMWYSCSIHLVVCITGSVERDNPDSHLEFQTVTGLRVLHEGACLWSCVFRWVWSAGRWAWLRPAGTPAVPARPCETLWRVCVDTASHTSWWAPSERLREEISDRDEQLTFWVNYA